MSQLSHHPAFETADNLKGRLHGEWAALAREAEKNDCFVLAVKYWRNAYNTTLSLSAARRYMENSYKANSKIKR